MFRFLLFVPMFLFLSGCGVLIGNTKPVTEKADDYTILDLSRESASDWQALSSAENQDPNASSDRAWQSKSTSAIISINTTCRKRITDETSDLVDYSAQLLLGVTNVQFRESRERRVAETPALETTVEGMLQGESVRMRAIVLKRAECLYDLVYLGRPRGGQTSRKPPAQETDFERFVESLRIK